MLVGVPYRGLFAYHLSRCRFGLSCHVTDSGTAWRGSGTCRECASHFLLFFIVRLVIQSQYVVLPELRPTSPALAHLVTAFVIIAAHWIQWIDYVGLTFFPRELKRRLQLRVTVHLLMLRFQQP